MIENTRFRAAMSRPGAAVNMITTDGAAERHGITVSAVCSVTDEPASLSACVNRASRMSTVVEANGAFCVNVLCGRQEALSGSFANKALTTSERFPGADWHVLSNGVPALVGALCSFGCEVEAAHIVGTHSVFVGRVVDIRTEGDGEGLVYSGRRYHRLPHPANA